MKQDISISYLHTDHLGSTNKTTGASASTQTYYPYGAIRTSSGTVPTDYGFTGQKRDATANLKYYGARYYDPSLARFVQPDTIVPNPMDPQSLNRYAYVRNNPVNRIDPTGHEDCAPEDDWCWENRWYEAHGQCWSDAKQDWSKQCQPEFQDEGILKEVLGENGGLAIVQRADAARLFQMLLESAQKYISNLPPPNLIVIGIQAFANGTIAVVEASLQIVFDLQHLQIGYFGSPGYGLGLSGPDPLMNGSISVQFGYGWCLPPGCSGIADYKGWFFSGGLGGGIPGSPISFGGEYDTSATGSLESGGTANNYTQIFLGSVGIGSALINGYVAETYSIPIGDPIQYPNSASFSMAMYLTVAQYDRSLGLLVSTYSSIGYPYLCSVASNTSTCPAR